MRRSSKKFTAMLLAILMVISLLPSFALATESSVPANHVVISQVYGGGGNAGATYKNDFIELYNPTDNAVDLSGWSVQYASYAGTSWQVTTLSGSIAAGRYYLVQEAAGSGGTTELPTPDASGNISIGASNFKVALANSTTPYTTAVPTGAVDFVGAGTANSYEGSKAAPAPSNTVSVGRKVSGVDTDDNATDFQTMAVTPRNSSYYLDKLSVPTASTSGYVVSGTSVTLSCATDGADIYYTTDGSTPTTSSTKGNTVTVSDSMSVKAIAAKSGMTTSDIATFNYTVIALPTDDTTHDPVTTLPEDAISLKAVYGKTDGDTDVTTVGQVAYKFAGNSIILQDVIDNEIIGLQIYDYTNFSSYNVGDVVSVKGEVDIYGGVYQIKPSQAPAVITPLGTNDMTAFTAQTLTVPQIIAGGDKYVSEYIKLESMTLGSYNSSGNTTLTNGNDSVDIYKGADYTARYTAGDIVSVYAACSKNYATRQLRVGAVTDYENNTLVSKPTAGVAAGIITSGTQVSFSSRTEGASIKYNTTSASAAEWIDYSAAIAVTADTTFYVKAVKAGMTDSPVVTFAYTIAAAQPVIADGQYVIYNPANSKALSSIYTGNYNAGVDMSIAASAVSVKASTSEIWTVTNNEDGTVYISCAGGKLSMAASYSSTPLGETNDKWMLESAGEGLYYIKNVGRKSGDKNYMLEWYASAKDFSAYHTLASGSEGLFQMRFIPATPADGNYVLYNVANSKALSSKYSSNYNVGTDMTIAGNTATVSALSDNIWTLKNNDDGSVYISNGTDKLSMDTTYSSTPLNKTNDKWTLESAGAGLYYIKNVGRTTYLEWYSKFTTYSTIKAGQEGAFAFRLVPATEMAARTVDDGDYFIYSDSAKGVMKYAYGDSAGIVSATVNTDSTVTLGENYNGAAIYTFTYQVSGEGTGMYTIKINGSSKYLSASYGKFGLNDTVNDYCYWRVETATDGWHIINNKSGQYMEYYSSNGFCMYNYKEASDSIYIMKLCAANDAQKSLPTDVGHPGYIGTWPAAGNKPINGGKYLIWNKQSSYAFGPLGTDESTSYFTLAKATLDKNDSTKLIGENGALIFTVTVDGDYYIFENNGKYLACSENKSDGGNDENLLLTDTITDYCYWTLQETENGYVIFNKTGTYNSSKVCPEYYSGMFSGWTYKAGNNDIFAFKFYETEDTYGTGYVVNPKVVFNTVKDANRGVDYPVSFTLDDLGETQSVSVSATFTDGTNNKTVNYTPTMTGYKGAFTIPAADIADYTSITITVSAVSKESATHNANYSGSQAITVNDLPAIISVCPASNEQTGDDKRPAIIVNYANTGAGATYSMTVNGTPVTANAAGGQYTYTPASDIDNGKVTVTVTITRADNKTVSKTWSFYVGKSPSTPYFGQIHSHTSEYSDGSGTLESAYEYAMNQAQDVDFLIVTDHSNYFDTTSTASTDSMFDAGASSLLKADSGTQTLWQQARATAKYYDGLSSDFVCGYGYEMTWSGGPGHMNTYNSLGIVSRNNSALNSKSNNSGMLAFYDLMTDANEKGNTYTTGQIVAQFNHPGPTFGDFSDFTGWTEERDAIINLIEVGNGDGNEEGISYWSSYEYYDEALSLGWHLAPTNNQDNHKGRWGDANTCRTVVLTGNFTEAGLYEAMALRHVYSTEDQNLTVIYTMGDYLQGDIATNYADDTVTLTASISDFNEEALGTVNIIGQEGKILWTSGTINANSYELSKTIDNTDAYYYIKVVEADGDIAVTAPIWVDEVAATKYNAKASVSYEGTPEQNKQTAVTSTLTNSVGSAITLTGYTVTLDGTTVDTKTGLTEAIAKDAVKNITYNWIPTTYGSHTVSVTYNVTLSDGTTKLTPSATKKIYVKGTNYETVSTIADAKQVDEATGKGTEFTIRGTVTSNASGYDKDNAFFDCIYVQDATGGINVFPVSGEYQVGQVVELHGGITWYCGEIELNLSEDYGGYIKVIDESAALTPISPTKVTCAEAMSDDNIGLLMKVSGTITSIHKSADIIDRIYVSDGSGTEACLYINGYILNSKDKTTKFGASDLQVGSIVTCVGLGSRDVDELNGGYLARLRVRDRSEISYYTPVTNATVTVPASSNKGSVNVSATVSGSTAIISITDGQLAKIVSDGQDTGKVFIDLSLLNIENAVIPAKLVSAVHSAFGSDGIEIAMRNARVAFDSDALATINTGKEVTLSVETVKPSELSDEQTAVLGNQADSAIIVDVNVLVNGKQVSSFGDGNVTITVPYTPKAGEDTSKLVMWYLSDEGTITKVDGAYDSAKGGFVFNVKHLSTYVMAEFPFTDVAGSNWAYGDVAYAYNNGLFTGTTGVTFGPSVTMTRQMVWMVLGRIDGETPASYTEARDWAMKNGISDGSSPDADVTREQLATLIYRYEQMKGGGFTGNWMFLLPYADTASVSDWAYEGMAWCHMNGIVNGVGSNLVSPQGDALRSQVAAMLHRYCVLSK